MFTHGPDGAFGNRFVRQRVQALVSCGHVIIRPVAPTDADQISDLLERRGRTDGRNALSEHKYLRIGDPESIELVAVDDGDAVVGYAHVARRGASPGAEAHWAVELVPIPDEDTEVESEVSCRLIAEAAVRTEPTEERFVVWAWRPADQLAADRSGLTEQRLLTQMGRPLPVGRPWNLAAGVELRRFAPGADEARLIAANNSAFAGHPENGALDPTDLGRRMAQPWFDPDGILLADRGGEILGFCWTKVHPEGVGEIYIIGVVPTAQGMGLGRTLVLAGLDDLADRQGATRATLYTDGNDERAVGLYSGLGFTTEFENRVYGPPEEPDDS